MEQFQMHGYWSCVLSRQCLFTGEVEVDQLTGWRGQCWWGRGGVTAGPLTRPHNTIDLWANWLLNNQTPCRAAADTPSHYKHINTVSNHFRQKERCSLIT